VVYSHIPKVVIEEEEEVVDDSGGSGSEKGRVPKLKRSTSLPLNQSEAEKEVMREIEELVKSSEKRFNYELILSLILVIIDGLEERKGQRIPKYLDEGIERIVRVTCHNHPISTLSHPSFTNALLAIIPFNRDTIRVLFYYLFIL